MSTGESALKMYFLDLPAVVQISVLLNKEVGMGEPRSWDRKTERPPELFKARTAQRPILRGSKVHEPVLSYFEPFSVQFCVKIPIRDGNSKF